MPLLRKLFMSKQRRKSINEALSKNAKEFDELQERIESDERNQRGEVMNQFIQDMLKAGADLDSKESDRITEEAERKCNEISDEAERKRQQARKNYEHRNKQILSMR